MKNIAEIEAELLKNIVEKEAVVMKNIAEMEGIDEKYCLMEAGFSNKLILYTLRRIVLRRIVFFEFSAPICPRRIVLRRIVRTPDIHVYIHTCIYTHTNMVRHHTYMYIYICISISICRPTCILCTHTCQGKCLFQGILVSARVGQFYFMYLSVFQQQRHCANLY